MFKTVEDIERALLREKYIISRLGATALLLAGQLRKPLLVEGPAGVGKTELAKACSGAWGTKLIRLQCYEGLDEARALYDWDYQKQLLFLQTVKPDSWAQAKRDLYSVDFLLPRPVMKALQAESPVTLLIDEIDKSDEQFESLLLEALAEYQISIPEMGTITAINPPQVILTSNNTRELGDALRRRCIYLYLDYPTFEQEYDILRLHLPDMDADLTRQAVAIGQSLRRQGLLKPPSLSEILDWATAMQANGIKRIDADFLASSITVLIKNQPDLITVKEKLLSLLNTSTGGER